MIDKDIEILKKLKTDMDIETGNKTYRLGSEEQQAIENVLKELDTYKRIANMKLNDREEIIKNMCEHRCPIKSDYEEVKQELETYKKIAERYERECKMFRAFCRKIRKDEKRNVDEFNQGREYAYIQFLNLISGEQNWEHEGKYFDEVDKELIDWQEKR